MLNFIHTIICGNNKGKVHFKISDESVIDEEKYHRECEVQTFNFISDDKDEPKEYKVLVLGEAGVGKTTFIRALKEQIASQPKTFLESAKCSGLEEGGIRVFSGEIPSAPPVQAESHRQNNYVPTKTEFREYIPETNTESIIFDSAVEHAINKKYNKEVAQFMIRPHFHKDDKFFLMEKKYMRQYNNLQKQNTGKIEIVEMPSTTRKFPPNFEFQFDKIVIIGDYHDITTIRSIKYWAELVNAPKNKIIACVNKCDLSPISIPDDFQQRKALLLRYFFENFNLEFMSVKTGANLEFIYKYL